VESDEVETRLWGESPESSAAPQITFDCSCGVQLGGQASVGGSNGRHKNRLFYSIVGLD